MRHNKLSMFFGIVLSGIVGWYALAMGQATLQAQVEIEQPEVSPEILAFLTDIEPNTDDDKLQSTLKERHNTAVVLLKARIEEYRNGRRELNDVFEAARLVAQSKLDLAASDEDRRTALNETLEVAKLIESAQENQVEQGFGSVGDVARARFARLGVEVEILKLQPGDKAPSP